MPDLPALAPDYATARRRFLDAARAVGAEVAHHPHPGRGPDGGELAVDEAWLGPADAPHAILVVSGTHGIEGFAGSLCQSHWLEQHGADPLPDGLALLFVHAHNPYGFAWQRRVDEDNVDLNRNSIDHADPPANDAYEELAEALAPPTWTEESRAASDAVILAWATEHGVEAVQAAVTSGQYRHPDGLFYGGTGPVWSLRTMQALVTERLARAERVAVLDLHTGLGPWAEVELITHERPDTDAFDRSVSWWGGKVASMVNGDSVSADVSGDWLAAVQRWLAPREVTTVALEWGTVDAISVLQALRADNWLHAHGDPTGPDAPAIKAQIRAAFAPDDPEWAARVVACFDETLANTVAALS